MENCSCYIFEGMMWWSFRRQRSRSWHAGKTKGKCIKVRFSSNELWLDQDYIECYKTMFRKGFQRRTSSSLFGCSYHTVDQIMNTLRTNMKNLIFLSNPKNDYLVWNCLASGKRWSLQLKKTCGWRLDKQQGSSWSTEQKYLRKDL